MRERRGTPIQAGDITIIPIVETRVNTVQGPRGLYVWGSVAAVAVVVRRSGHEERVEIRRDQHTDDAVQEERR